jgi:hypothetical protein
VQPEQYDGQHKHGHVELESRVAGTRRGDESKRDTASRKRERNPRAAAARGQRGSDHGLSDARGQNTHRERQRLSEDLYVL